MNDATTTVTHTTLDDWATKAVGPVALRLKQKLLPVEESGIIFPPTYADIGYNIDTLSDGTRVATIDSVGSQANRLEPILESDSAKPEDWLVPQVRIVIRREPCGKCEACQNMPLSGNNKKAKKEGCTQPREVTRSLLDLAHRAADAVVQASPDLQSIIEDAFTALKRGDAGPLCTAAPTSLVFGVWDSRGDGEKRPRLVRSIIRAWDVEVLHAAAQFNSVWNDLREESRVSLENEAKVKKVELSQKGLNDAPATFRKVGASAANHMREFVNGSPNPERRVLGGVLVRGQIEREVTINLVALRGLRGKHEPETDFIRKYLLGLALTAATHDIEMFLREGCLLRYADSADQWYAVPRRGEPTLISLSHEMVGNYAKGAAAHFQSRWPEVFQGNWPNLKYDFNLDEAKKLLVKKSAEEESPAE